MNPIMVLLFPASGAGNMIDKNRNTMNKNIPLYKLDAAFSLFLNFSDSGSEKI